MPSAPTVPLHPAVPTFGGMPATKKFWACVMELPGGGAGKV